MFSYLFPFLIYLIINKFCLDVKSWYVNTPMKSYTYKYFKAVLIVAYIKSITYTVKNSYKTTLKGYYFDGYLMFF